MDIRRHHRPNRQLPSISVLAVEVVQADQLSKVCLACRHTRTGKETSTLHRPERNGAQMSDGSASKPCDQRPPHCSFRCLYSPACTATKDESSVQLQTARMHLSAVVGEECAPGEAMGDRELGCRVVLKKAGLCHRPNGHFVMRGRLREHSAWQAERAGGSVGHHHRHLVDEAALQEVIRTVSGRLQRTLAGDLQAHAATWIQ